MNKWNSAIRDGIKDSFKFFANRLIDHNDQGEYDELIDDLRDWSAHAQAIFVGLDLSKDDVQDDLIELIGNLNEMGIVPGLWDRDTQYHYTFLITVVITMGMDAL